MVYITFIPLYIILNINFSVQIQEKIQNNDEASLQP